MSKSTINQHAVRDPQAYLISRSPVGGSCLIIHASRNDRNMQVNGAR